MNTPMLNTGWEVVIGLETHVQLQTQSKIFSGASTAFGAEPNRQACAVDIALPGVLPVLNREAVVCAIKFGLAVGAEIAPRSIFARKNYFYPDLPKGYQISQYEIPVVSGGGLTIKVGLGGTAGGQHDATKGSEAVAASEKFVRLTRAHLEEDAGKSLHEDFHGKTGIDLNRAGTPLLEIVSEPDMRSAAEAVAYAKALHTLVTWIGICDGNMQEGSFRCDANVSVRPRGQQAFGTRREIKNLNSFRFMQQAIDYEVQWQINEISEGRTIQQATVLFDPDSGETRAMRSKEDAHDYRYFPDPDLLPLEITPAWIAEVRATLPELPEVMKQRFETEYVISASDAEVLTQSMVHAQYFENTVKCIHEFGPARTSLLNEVKAAFGSDVAKWINGDLAAALSKRDIALAASPLTAMHLAHLVIERHQNRISRKSAIEIMYAILDEGMTGVNAVADLIEERNLRQVSDAGMVESIIDSVLAANEKSVAEFRAGKEKAFNALVGQVMKATKGKASPQQVDSLLRKKLGV